jgi:sigma-B regulation protein RsbU (phosphoserine phosphatase)
MPNILIADDQYEILLALKLLLKQEGFQTVMASSPEAVIEEAKRTPFDLILIDLNYTRDTTSGREGLDLIARLRQMPHVAPVIVMTAWSTVPLAVEAMRLGAADFIEKPWDNNRLLSLLKQHLSPNEARPQRGLTAAADLEIARSVQNRLLPQEWPELATLDYAVKYQPAGLVGGDYYDFLPSGVGALTFVVADVSGKGISAAILMATIQSFFRSREAREFSDLAALVATLNTLFLQSSPAEQYATLFVMRYSEVTREAEWINCGHTPPLLCKPGARAVELEPSATVLGMFPGWEGSTQRFTLDAGDTLLIFSDGLIEACNDRNEEFGTERLLAHWDGWKNLEPRDLVQAIGKAIRDHSAGPLSDDLTILALRSRHARHNASPAATLSLTTA